MHTVRDDSNLPLGKSLSWIERESACSVPIVCLLCFIAGCTPSASTSPKVSPNAASPNTASPNTVAPVSVPVKGSDRFAHSEPSSIRNIVPRFETATPGLGIDFVYHNDAVNGRYFLPEVMGGGAAWIDVDHDGWLDLFLANGCSLNDSPSQGVSITSRLWLNHRGERFEEITDRAQAGLTMYGQGCAVGDFDCDGFADLYVGGFGADRLLRNQGDGTFADATQHAGISGQEWTSSAVWIDIDDDNDLDLYAVNYLNVSFENHKICEYSGRPGYCGPGSYDAVQDGIFINRGDGTFVESGEQLGFRADGGKGLAVAAVDFDGDLIPEIYVGNDMTANFLFARKPTSGGGKELPRYTEIAAQSGCAVGGSGLNEASMGISLADFDGDGRTDIYLTHYYHTKNTLYRNLGGLIFDDISNWSRTTATSHESLGFGTVPIDFDRDGDPDIFVANGHVLGPQQQPNEMRPQLLRNDKGIFHDVSSMAGQYFNELWLGRSVAAADYDNDGDIDLAITHLNRSFTLLRNVTPAQSRSFVGLKLETRDRMPPVGGRVVLRTDRRDIVHALCAGGSYLAAPDTRLVLCWPETETLREVEVHWPSRRVDRWNDLATCCYWDLVEGRQPARSSLEIQSVPKVAN